MTRSVLFLIDSTSCKEEIRGKFTDFGSEEDHTFRRYCQKCFTTYFSLISLFHSLMSYFLFGMDERDHRFKTFSESALASLFAFLIMISHTPFRKNLRFWFSFTLIGVPRALPVACSSKRSPSSTLHLDTSTRYISGNPSFQSSDLHRLFSRIATSASFAPNLQRAIIMDDWCVANVIRRHTPTPVRSSISPHCN